MSKRQEAVDEQIEQEEWDAAFAGVPVSDEQLTQAEKREILLRDLKSRLPMLYTVYGNVIKNNPPRVSGKNYRTLSDQIDAVNFQRGHMITIHAPDWEMTLTPEISDMLRDFKQVEHLILAGWKLV